MPHQCTKRRIVSFIVSISMINACNASHFVVAHDSSTKSDLTTIRTPDLNKRDQQLPKFDAAIPDIFLPDSAPDATADQTMPTQCGSCSNAPAGKSLCKWSKEPLPDLQPMMGNYDGVSAGAPDNLWAFTYGYKSEGNLMRYDGQQWTNISPDNFSPQAMLTTSSETLAIGTPPYPVNDKYPKIYRYSQNAWQFIVELPVGRFTNIWRAPAGKQIWVLGGENEWDISWLQSTASGYQLVKKPSPCADQHCKLGAIGGTSDTDIWAAVTLQSYGTTYQLTRTFFHYDGTTWTKTAGIGPALQKKMTNEGGQYPYSVSDIWASAADNVWASGYTVEFYPNKYNGFILHYDGTTWSEHSCMNLNGRGLFRLWGRNASDIWAVGWGDTVLHYDGNCWLTETNPSAAGYFFVDISGVSDGRFWVSAVKSVLRCDR